VKTWIFAPSGSKAENFGAKEIFGFAFIVEQSIEPPTTDVEDPHVYGYVFIYQVKSLICHFNGLWPSAFALRECVNKTWWLGQERFFCSKGFFIVNFSTKENSQHLLEKGPWFWGRYGLSMQRWFPKFNPLTMTSLTTPVLVRLPNLPLHFYTPYFLLTLGNVLGKFININKDWITKGFVTFLCICIEINLIQGLLDRILIDWDENDPYMKMINYENTSFKCFSCQQTGHLQATCPLSPTLASSPGVKKSLMVGNTLKMLLTLHLQHHHHKDALTPSHSTTPT
jgi:hypothetical protein